uniref:hypothetical protein n=1 Tax=Ndongobacter massiliensis TaxID=1871025 RepID=UPI00093183ED|nr:hypothetical protein [Ndongobacter massiliensis]
MKRLAYTGVLALTVFLTACGGSTPKESSEKAEVSSESVEASSQESSSVSVSSESKKETSQSFSYGDGFDGSVTEEEKEWMSQTLLTLFKGEPEEVKGILGGSAKEEIEQGGPSALESALSPFVLAGEPQMLQGAEKETAQDEGNDVTLYTAYVIGSKEQLVAQLARGADDRLVSFYVQLYQDQEANQKEYAAEIETSKEVHEVLIKKDEEAFLKMTGETIGSEEQRRSLFEDLTALLEQGGAEKSFELTDVYVRERLPEERFLPFAGDRIIEVYMYGEYEQWNLVYTFLYDLEGNLVGLQMQADE